jgi:hypothetical protein
MLLKYTGIKIPAIIVTTTMWLIVVVTAMTWYVMLG